VPKLKLRAFTGRSRECIHEDGEFGSINHNFQ
jgi:hypothetical protein